MCPNTVLKLWSSVICGDSNDGLFGIESPLEVTRQFVKCHTTMCHGDSDTHCLDLPSIWINMIILGFIGGVRRVQHAQNLRGHN